MSKWLVHSWGNEDLEVEADEMDLQDGALVFTTAGKTVLILADGTFQTVFAQDASECARRVLGRGLALVVDIKSTSKEKA